MDGMNETLTPEEQAFLDEVRYGYGDLPSSNDRLTAAEARVRDWERRKTATTSR